MEFECKKVENCFAASRTWEYRLPLTAEKFLALLPDTWEKRQNPRLRRPTFSADRNGVNLKGILAGNLLRASFPEERWEREKAEFEKFLEEN